MNPLRYFLPLLFCACFPAMAAQPAGQGMGIAAVVGDEAISSFDVENRIRFILATTKLSDTPEVIERIRPQVVRSLIDERLQLREAARENIAISDEEVKQAIVTIEQSRGMQSGAVLRLLAAHKLPEETFTQQIRAQLAWNKLMLRKVRPQVKVSAEEVDLARKRFRAPQVNQELKIAVIALPVDKPQHETEVKKLADKLVGEMRGGASFEEVARQFSSGSATAGGKIESFWVRPGQLDPAIGKALAAARAGFITPAVRTNDGYSIVKVYEARALTEPEKPDAEVMLKEILLKLKPDSDRKEADVLLAIGNEVAKNPGTCKEQSMAGIRDLEDFDIDVSFLRDFLSNLPPALRIIAENLKVGEISTPFASSDGLRLYMLCERKDGISKSADPERISNLLFQQKMELEAQKYLRNLRREAFIEIR